MSTKKIHFKIITHDNIVYEEDIDAIYTKGVDGEFGVLIDHTPFMSALDIGVTKIQNENEEEFFSTIGGIFQFKSNEAVILTELAERGKDIDIARAENAKARAEARLGSTETENDIQRAKLALAKSMARLRAASKLS